MRNNWVGRIAIAAVGTAALIAPRVAPAQFYDGNKLYGFCTARESEATYYQQDARCTAYIIGAVDELTLLQQAHGLPACLPANATVGQLRDVVEKYLRDHPEKRAFAASAMVSVALREAFACQLPIDKN